MQEIGIGRVRFWCQKVIPLVYDDSLSYYEQLCKFAYKLNEIIEKVNSMDNSYIDEQIAIINERITNEVNQLSNQIQSVKEYSDIQNSLLENKLIGIINTQISQVQDLVYKLSDETKEYTKLQLQIFMDELRTTHLPPVFNPFTGQWDSINNVLNYMYEYFRYDSLTAGEYDALNLTAEEYDNHELTALEYDLHGKSLLTPDYVYSMISPFTGLLTPVKNVVSALADLHRQNYTAGEYNAFNLTAGEYDALNLTAYDYDWKAWRT